MLLNMSIICPMGIMSFGPWTYNILCLLPLGHYVFYPFWPLDIMSFTPWTLCPRGKHYVQKKAGGFVANLEIGHYVYP